MAELRKIGCKMREWRLRELSSLILQRSRFFTVIIFFHQQSLKSVHLKSRSWVHSEKQENQSKNRFNNIVACKFSTLQCMVDLQVYILVEDQYNEPPYIRQTPAPHFHSIRGRGQEYYSMIIIIKVHLRQVFNVLPCVICFIPAKCHACRSKTWISCLLTPVFRFVTTGGKVWAITALTDTFWKIY